MKAILITDLERRVKKQTNQLKFLKEHEVTAWFNKAVEIIFIHTRPRGDQESFCFAEVITNLGKAILREIGERFNSSLAAKVGGFVLFTFHKHKIINVYLTRGANKHNIYLVQVVNDEVLSKMFKELPLKQIEKLPLLTPSANYNSCYHVSGLKMIKTNNTKILKSVKPETHPMVFNSINRAQQVGWKINEQVKEIARWALTNKQEAFSDIWQQKAEARRTKIREAQTIFDIADMFKGKIFYHQYFLDFRGRKYNNTTYLNEQGSDLAKGILLRADSKRLGKIGYFWFCASLASTWGGPCGRLDDRTSDKIPILERVQWVKANLEVFLSYADNPKVNTGWMFADKPWVFLAHCFELRKMQPNPELYSCSLEGYIDGQLAVIKLCEFGGHPERAIPSQAPS